MRKVNVNDITEMSWSSPKGKFAGAGKEVSEELGRKPLSTDLKERHPFDLEILRIPPGKRPYPYHSHSAQWELYHVVSGKGVVRDKDGTTEIESGDAFLFKRERRQQVLGPDIAVPECLRLPVGERDHMPAAVAKTAALEPDHGSPAGWS